MEQTRRRPGARRRVEWSELPANRLLTIGEAAAIMRITRGTLLREYAGGRCTLPADVEVVRDNKRAVGIRRNV